MKRYFIQEDFCPIEGRQWAVYKKRFLWFPKFVSGEHTRTSAAKLCQKLNKKSAQYLPG